MLGGITSSVHRLSLRLPTGGSTHVVLKRFTDPDWGDTHAIVQNEAAAITAVEQIDVPAPRLLGMSADGAETDGVPSLLMTRAAGRVWLTPHDVDSWIRQLATLLPTYQRDSLLQILMNRGFTADETTRLEAYLASRDASAEAAQRKLPVALSFSKVVRKYDKLRRPVPDAVVLSYIYQRERAGAEATREWAAGLLDSIGAHGARILLSAISEGASTTIWAPSDQPGGIADTLAAVRQPDFEQQATARSLGAKP
jgi:hypothetical protein